MSGGEQQDGMPGCEQQDEGPRMPGQWEQVALVRAWMRWLDQKVRYFWDGNAAVV